MDKKTNIKDIELVLGDDVKNVFTDLIQLNINNETVNIRLAVKNVDNSTAKVSHNVIMTLPHFLRFADICQQSAEKIIKQIESQKSE
ncbi:hypothetical protein [Mesoflavibacter sp. SCSIO 43206]|uniref:hypothetical protein n=1 Tax=Mesoflavibacter sp. SCSIO 43206 TaxID=2779362 RepID=UPI001CA9A279|nr:hypothetical protein [Mesoflavibacter sp. SCSIO 43206]UAB75585.1 hypothetical protein INR78_00945 [Mesoflavibacter sp. SCSIO 43206]